MKKILVISGVVPQDKSGGSIVLKRHFEWSRNLKFEVVESVSVLKKNLIYRILNWLENFRYRSYILAVKPLYQHYCLSINRKFPFDDYSAVLTVANGKACFIAERVSQVMDIPLITVFHDWHFVSSGANRNLSWFWDKGFKRLYRNSQLAFCVSEQMKEKLGSHPSATVLYPISSRSLPGKIQLPRPHAPINVFYAGHCMGAYKNMLQRVIQSVGKNPKFNFYISGMESEAFGDVAAQCTNIYVNGFIDESELNDYFNKADVLLVLIDFNPAKRIHFSTHFPSKIVDYCQRERLIVVWGPSYSTAVQWAKETGAALFYEKEDIEGLLSLLHSIHLREDLRQVLSNAKRISETVFNPNNIQNLFEEEVMKVIKGKNGER